MNRVYLDVSATGLTVYLNNKVVGVAKNKQQFADLLIKHKITPDDIVMCSSSLDFPEEYTSDPDILALVGMINGTDEELTLDELIDERDRVLVDDDSLIARSEKLGNTLQRLMGASPDNIMDVKKEALDQIHIIQTQLNSITELLSGNHRMLDNL